MNTDLNHSYNFPVSTLTDGPLPNLLEQPQKSITVASINEEIGNDFDELQTDYDYDPNASYEGDIKNDRPHDKGKITFSNGTIYEGEFKEGKLNGYGKISFSSGTIYEGEFKNGKLNGQGKIWFSNGTVYESEFQEGKLNGQGKITFSNGTIYIGEFKEGKFDGKGKLMYASGKVFEGEFKSGRFYRSIHPQIKTLKPQFRIDHIPLLKKTFQLNDLQDVFLNLSDSLGPSPTGITERYVAYMRSLIFGFSIGQKREIKAIGSQSGIGLKALKTLQGSHTQIHMVYVAYHVNKLISEIQSKNSDEVDKKYLEDLEKLHYTLQRSLPIALMQYYIAHQNNQDEILEQLAQGICEELDRMKQEEQLLVPLSIKKHATLLTFKKLENGTLQPTFYNTGRGVENHLTTDLNIEGLMDALNAIRHYYPTSINYSPIDLKSDEGNFKSMIINLLKLRSQTDPRKLYAVLESTLGKGKKGPARLAQINGICSFQVLTEAFKDILSSKLIYNTYKLDLLNSIQDEFQDITDAMKLLIDENDQIKNFYRLHQILLKESQDQIDITKRVIAQTPKG